MITVQNLIEQLKHMPPNLPVRVNLSSVTICYEDGQDTFNLDETDGFSLAARLKVSLKHETE